MVDINISEGETAVFKCTTDAEPPAIVQWYINGELTDRKNYIPFLPFYETPSDQRVLHISTYIAIAYYFW